MPPGDTRRVEPTTPCCLGLRTGFWRVILSAPQYEKLILLFLSESSDSPSPSSSSSGSGTILGCAADRASALERTTLQTAQQPSVIRAQSTHSSIETTPSLGWTTSPIAQVSIYARVRTSQTVSSVFYLKKLVQIPRLRMRISPPCRGIL